uniref:Uncharacterized protein n=1 Tax=Phlebotomus papatasi TaxID=29031 RepID=A0A1B0CYT8_PHLPP
MDESAFCLAPTGEIVLGPTNQHVYIESSKSNKEYITTLFTVSASGEFAPPLTLYKYERMPAAAAISAPPHWGIGKSESGWMLASTFYEYIANVFIPYLNQKKIKRPVAVFLDGHSSHMTLHLSRLCREHEIILIALYPNATHILQPLDVAVFKPVKSRWQYLKRAWRINHNGQEVSKFDVPTLLNAVISEDQMGNNIRSGFRATGLYPFDSTKVDYSKIIERKAFAEKEDQTHTQETFEKEDIVKFIKYIELKIGPSLLDAFKSTRENGEEWKGAIDMMQTYNMWNEMTTDLEKTAIQAPSLVRKVLSDTLAKAIYWPEAPKKKRCREENVPSVITADKWVDHFEKKEDEKKRIELEKLERRRQNEEKKIKKEEEKLKKDEEKKNKQVQKVKCPKKSKTVKENQ